MSFMYDQKVAIGTSENPDDASAKMSIHLTSGRKDRLAVVFHGRNGSATAPHMVSIAQAYTENGYTVVAPDCCGSAANDSAGAGEDYTLAMNLRDARRTVDWVSHIFADGASPGLALAGHSMGAYVAAVMAREEKNAKHLLSVSSFTSGANLLSAREKYHEDGINRLRREGPRFMAELPLHDIFTFAAFLTLPLATIVGCDDTITTPDHVRTFSDAAPGTIAHCEVYGEHHCLIKESSAFLMADMVAKLDASAQAKQLEGFHHG